MTGKTVAEALAENPGPLAAKVLNYAVAFKRVADQAKQRGLTEADWAPLAAFVATDEFVRVGVAKEVMNWQEYTAFLTGFATSMGWNGYFRRVTEVPGLVFLELEEHCDIAGKVDIANTMTVYEFNHAGKIKHLDVYLQHET